MTGQDVELLREIGLVGYLLLACIVTGVGITSWMVKRLVDALVTSHQSTTAAISEIAKHEATEQELLDRIVHVMEDSARIATSTHEIARQWQIEGARKI